jgi:L-asparaginase
MKPKVVVIGTGGTIASRYDAVLNRKVAVASGEELTAMLPGADGVAELEVDDFTTAHSFQMDGGAALGLAQRIGETLRRPDVTGVAVAHGTDTLEESAYLAELLVESEKPVVFTGAQRSADEPDGDGPRNLMGAIRAAAAPVSAGLGVFVCFNDELHAARDVTKTHTSAVQTFQSLDHGKLGLIDGERVVVDRRPLRRPRYAVERLEERVDLVLCSRPSASATPPPRSPRGCGGRSARVCRLSSLRAARWAGSGRFMVAAVAAATSRTWAPSTPVTLPASRHACC